MDLWHLRGIYFKIYFLRLLLTPLCLPRNETTYLGIEQIQAHSVVHDITIVGHIPVAAQRKGTVCLLKSISKHRSKRTKCGRFLERLHTNTMDLIKKKKQPETQHDDMKLDKLTNVQLDINVLLNLKEFEAQLCEWNSTKAALYFY